MLNKVQSKSVVVTPYEIWTNKDPCFSHLNVWVILLKRSKLCQTKLEAKSDRCLFVGYPKEFLDIVSTKLCSKSCLF